jgi:hypothetical protein
MRSRREYSDMDKNIGCQCFICGQRIDGTGGVDPCGVDLIANVEKDEKPLNFQRFYCHMKCFKEINKYSAVYKPKFEDVYE